MRSFDSLVVERDGPVLTIRIIPLRTSLTRDPPADIHRDLGLLLDELRHDYSVRVVVLTGAEDGEFCAAPPGGSYNSQRSLDRLVGPEGQWTTFMGLIHTHQTMTDLEIPIIARVNGDAIGFGQSLMLSCDLIIAREDARITDVHLAMGEVSSADGKGPVGPIFGTVINRAVPMADLDLAVDEMVDGLLERPPYALGWTKRIVNARVRDQLNRALDSSTAYEMVNFLHFKVGGAPTGHQRSGNQD
jgi:enoyl-CoA hydratase